MRDHSLGNILESPTVCGNDFNCPSFDDLKTEAIRGFQEKVDSPRAKTPVKVRKVLIRGMIDVPRKRKGDADRIK
jgi:hypothetical protein